MKNLIALMILLMTTSLFAQDLEATPEQKQAGAMEMQDLFTTTEEVLSTVPKAKKEFAAWKSDWDQWDFESPFDPKRLDRLNSDYWDAKQQSVKDLAFLVVGWIMEDERLEKHTIFLQALFTAVYNSIQETLDELTAFYGDEFDTISRKIMRSVHVQRMVLNHTFDGYYVLLWGWEQSKRLSLMR